MKFRYILSVIVLLMIMTACSSHSNPLEIARPTPAAFLNTLKLRMSLTDEQMKVIAPIIEQDFAEKEIVFSAEKKRDRKAMNELLLKIEDIEWQTYKSLSEFLSKEQMEMFNQVLKEERDKMKGHKPPEDGGRTPHSGSRTGN